jgi:oligopeptide transport system substrate-binding protein
MKNKVSRRHFLRAAGLAAAGIGLAACAPQTVTVIVTQQVEKQVQVTKEVEKVVTKQVEKVVEVTSTPMPNFKTPQGRVLPADAAPLAKQYFVQMGAEPKHLDGARDIYSGAGLNVGTETLIRNDENQKLVPAMAESWKAGPNAEYWEFKLRKDAVWSDGVPITADDWVYTFKHVADPKLANPWIWFYFDIKGVQAYASGKGGADGIGVTKIDDQTFRIYGEHGSIPYLPALMSYQASVCVPKHKAEKDPEHWADTIENYVSSGPYIPTKWEHNKQMVWDINPKYNGVQNPGIQRVINPLVPAGTAAFNLFLNKDVDLLHILGPSDLAQARADPKLNALLHFFNNFQSEYLALDTMKAPLNNLKLRQALSHAIDRDTMCTSVLAGAAIPGYSMLPPGFPAYNAELKKVQTYDVATAKGLLTEAGYADPKSLELTIFSGGRDPKLEFVKEQWETNLGIKVNLTVLEASVWGEKRGKHEMQIYKGPYEYDYLDPSNMLTGLWRSADEKGSPRHAWKSVKFDELVTAAGSEVDVEKRTKQFQDAERILVEDVGGIFLSHEVVFQIWWPYLTGMHPDVNGNVVFRWLDLARYQMYINKDVDQYRKA